MNHTAAPDIVGAICAFIAILFAGFVFKIAVNRIAPDGLKIGLGRLLLAFLLMVLLLALCGLYQSNWTYPWALLIVPVAWVFVVMLVLRRCFVHAVQLVFVFCFTLLATHMLLRWFAQYLARHGGLHGFFTHWRQLFN